MKMKALPLGAVVLAAVLAAPALAQSIPSAFQGKWVSSGDGRLGAAKLRQYCRQQQHDEGVSYLEVQGQGFKLYGIGSETTADRLRLSSRSDSRVAGTARTVTVYDDESEERSNNQRFEWRLANGLLQYRSDGVRLLFQRCQR